MESGRTERNFGLDLIRAVAVSLVLFSHCGDIFALWLGGRNPLLLDYGGQFGVDLFFVLSGFLIGGILINDLDTAEAGDNAARSFGVFMLRRWMRTLPLYYVWGGILALVWAPILWGAAARTQLAAALPVYLAMLQNLAWPIKAPGLFDVTWSLAVEEWFYLGFSALLFGVWRLIGARAALPCATSLFLFGPMVLRWWTGIDATSHAHIAIYWLDSIAVGVVAAWLRARYARSFAAAVWLMPVAAAVVVVMYAGGLARLHVAPRWCKVFDSDFRSVGFALLLPAASRWREARGLLARLVRTMSRYSYAVYLVHLSVLEYVGAHRFVWTRNSAVLIASSIVATVLLAWGMSRLIEQPIMALRPRSRARRLVSGP